MASRSPDYSVEDMVACYRAGVFPMADARDDDRIFLVDPEQRGVIPLDAFHLPRRLARTVRADRYLVRVDSAFDAVVQACAEARPGRTETWINAPIQRLYGELFARGQAHSVECWQADAPDHAERDAGGKPLGPSPHPALVGGLYGVALGGAFFGESMFSVARDASKVALAHLVARLRVGGFQLLDTQFLTEHLAQFGARDVPRAVYRKLLAQALAQDADFYRLPAYAGGEAVLQAINQAS
jgi:leucyl/phenylalanyl-tRNA--protein transferase